MVTIKDIANAAHVSTATVSMALNGKDCISKRTKNKILTIAKQMNYIPSVSAKALKTKRSRTLGLVVGHLANAYFIDIISAAEEIARQNGYNLFICDAGLSAENALECFQALKSRDVDGILFSLSLDVDELFVDALKSIVDSGTYIISLTRCVEDPKIPIVTFNDNEQVCQLITRLVALGHRYVGAIGAPRGSWINKYRLKEFSRVTSEYDIHRDDYITYAELTLDDGKRHALELLVNHPEITAIYAINDIVALGALQAAEELGRMVPEQLSLVGSDGIPVVSFTSPKITTVITPRKEIGRIATKKLIDLIEDRGAESENYITIPCICQEGGSIAKPPDLR
jgi:DNA-binding LacI/PurR family transcriptional regulator